MSWPSTWPWYSQVVPLYAYWRLNGHNRQGLTRARGYLQSLQVPHLHKSLYSMGDSCREQEAKERRTSGLGLSGKWMESCQVKSGWSDIIRGQVTRGEVTSEGETRTRRDWKLKFKPLYLQKENMSQNQDPGYHRIWRSLVETLGWYLRAGIEEIDDFA